MTKRWHPVGGWDHKYFCGCDPCITRWNRFQQLRALWDFLIHAERTGNEP